LLNQKYVSNKFHDINAGNLPFTEMLCRHDTTSPSISDPSRHDTPDLSSEHLRVSCRELFTVWECTWLSIFWWYMSTYLVELRICIVDMTYLVLGFLSRSYRVLIWPLIQLYLLIFFIMMLCIVIHMSYQSCSIFRVHLQWDGNVEIPSRRFDIHLVRLTLLHILYLLYNSLLTVLFMNFF
jgi:hypothetical protein